MHGLKFPLHFPMIFIFTIKYKMSILSKDINECEIGTHSCGQFETCLNTPGVFRCIPPEKNCLDGYTSDESGNCNDLDECATGNFKCPAESSCVNVPGSFMCTCRDGFETSGQSCVDVNECSSNFDPCGDLVCINMIGSYKCGLKRKNECPKGLQYNPIRRRCVDIDECLISNPCLPSENCQNLHGSWRCYSKIRCDFGFNPNVDGTRCNGEFLTTKKLLKFLLREPTGVWNC